MPRMMLHTPATSIRSPLPPLYLYRRGLTRAGANEG